MGEVTLMNPTKENMEPLFGGKPVPLPPGAKIRVHDSIGNHIINGYGARGIISLDYDDGTTKSKHDRTKTIEEWKIIKGLERNKEFQIKQIVAINQQNEKRKHEKQSYIEPSAQVVEYAENQGIELLTPYSVTDKEQVKSNELKEENLELREQNLQLQKQNMSIMDKLDKILAGQTVSPEELKEAAAEPDADKEKFEQMKNQFYRLGKDNFKTYCAAQEAEMKAWPEALKTIAREKHIHLGLGELVI